MSFSFGRVMVLFLLSLDYLDTQFNFAFSLSVYTSSAFAHPPYCGLVLCSNIFCESRDRVVFRV